MSSADQLSDSGENRKGAGRYARLEREQRWLVATLPPGLVEPRKILDRYLFGTDLRLRRVESSGEVVFKLGQKIPSPGNPSVAWITNLNVSPEEYRRLCSLGAAVIEKTRWSVPGGGPRVVVDEFRKRHTGLVLAEVELGEFDSWLRAPDFALRDVTKDVRFSGGRLAVISDDELAALLLSCGVNPSPIRAAGESQGPLDEK